MTTPRGEDRPVDLSALPDEEGVDAADAADRLDKDPDDQPREAEQGEPETVEGTTI
jgi:hypothetical protein